MRLIENHWYKFNDRGEIHVGVYVGTRKSFECSVCGKRSKVHGFNVWSKNPLNYNLFTYDKEHMPVIVEDLGIIGGLLFDGGEKR